MSSKDYYDRHFTPAPRRYSCPGQDKDWDSWIWQQQNRLRTLADLEGILNLTEAEKAAFASCSEQFRVALTPYYASLMDPDDPQCPIRRQGVPSPEEQVVRAGEMLDPLGEEGQSPLPGLVHRYPDRVLLYTNHNCPVYCRHCTRKRKVGDPSSAPHRTDLAAATSYIADHPEVREVVLSGGDPLSLSDARLEEILEALYRVPHLEVVRIGSRNPVTLPQRIDPGLVRMLGRFPGLVVMTHFNHPRECTQESLRACLLLAGAGIPVYNQMVLLRGINDSAETVDRLNRLLLMMKVRPYYIFHCDAAQGVSHFRISIEEGLEIMRSLEGRTSGIGVPVYVVDFPGGGGKVRLGGQFGAGAKVSSPGTGWVQGFDGTWHQLPD